jgi:hypothetical protein
VRFEFKSGIFLFCFSFTFVSFGESCLLVSWCVGGRCDMACSNEDRGRSRRPGAEDRGWSHRPGTRWPGERVFMLCMQCSYVHLQCFVCNALIFIYFVKNVGSVTKPMRHIFWTDMSHMCHACDM